MDNIKAVLLDFDGTLGDRPIYTYNFICEILKQQMPEVEEGSILFEAMAQDLMNWDEYGNISRLHMKEQFKKKYGKEFDYDFFQKYWSEHHCLKPVLFDGTIEVLKYLKNKYKLAIITNGMEYGQNLKIDNSGIRDYFDIVVVGETVGHQKPDKEIFEYTLEKLNVKPQEAVMVGDSFSKDILGAYNAGIKPIFIWPDDHRPCKADVLKIHDIKELMNIL